MTTKSGLKRHKTNHVHKNNMAALPPKSFVCDFPGCNNGFDTVYQLNGHKGIHSTKHRRSDASSSQS